MHGNPLFRVLALAVVLAVAGLIVSAVARNPKGEAVREEAAAEPAGWEGGSLPLHFSLHLSAPAQSVSVTSPDRRTTYMTVDRPAALTAEFRALVPAQDHAVSFLVNIEWEVPSEHRFIRVSVEPDYLESREHVEHVPGNLENHAVTFHWEDPQLVEP